jgi:type IV pilus assembly protein PilW
MSPARSRPFFPASAARGFSLVELMVALAVGLMLLAGLVALFANSSRASQELDRSMRQLENGRHGMELLGEDLNMAGYYGELGVEGAVLRAVDPCASNVDKLGWKSPALAPPTPLEVPVPVTGLDPDEAAGLDCLNDHLSGTPALVVRRLDTERVTPAQAVAGAVYLQTSRCATDPVAPLFWFGTVPATVEADPGAPFALRDLQCAAVSAVQRYIVRIYYVAGCNLCGLDTVPTLKRVELPNGRLKTSENPGAEPVLEGWPLAEGVQDLAFDFGFDTDGNGSVDVYRTGLSGDPGAADNDWANVVGVRVHLLSRSAEPSPGHTDSKTYALGLSGTRGAFNDGFKRRVYTMTSRLHNVAGPRETP